MTSNQLCIFDMPLQPYSKRPSIKPVIVSEPSVNDIRTEKQVNNKVSYDVGEKIGGARKDLVQQKKEFLENPSIALLEQLEVKSVDVAAEVVIREVFFSWFSYENCRERDVEARIAKAIQLFINRIPKSSKDTPEDRRKYVNTLTYISDILQTVKTMEEYYNFETRLMELFSTNRSMERVEQLLLDKEEEVNQSISQSGKNKLKREVQSLQARLHMFDLAKTMAFRDYAGPFLNYFTNSNSRVSTLRNAFKIENYDELISVEDKGKKKHSTSTKKVPIWERVLPENPVRSGGKAITITNPEKFVNHFGFRASEFGNYMEDDAGRKHLLHSAEAYTDLADILQIPISAVSLQKELAMAFGARGRGRALGHYEPGRKVINLTKERGSLGILAHEWFHALDHFLYNASYSFKNGKSGFLTSNEFGVISDGVQEALDNLLHVIKVGESIAYIDVRNSNKTYRVRGPFIELYEMVDGNLQQFMDTTINKIDKQTELMLSGIVSETYLKSQQSKYERKRASEIKRNAEALAEYHMKMTGEQVNLIPYTTDRAQYYQQAINMDKGKIGRYWSSNVELTARAFESYIFDQLEKRNWTSDYLVCGIRDSVFPQGIESELINGAMERLIRKIHPILVESVSAAEIKNS